MSYEKKKNSLIIILAALSQSFERDYRVHLTLFLISVLSVRAAGRPIVVTP